MNILMLLGGCLLICLRLWILGFIMFLFSYVEPEEL
jgi:hypothetical protein